MYIRNYQINNVLNVYRRQLSRGTPDRSRHPSTYVSESNGVSVSNKATNQSIMKKVADSVLKKITSVDPKLRIERENDKPAQQIEKQTHMFRKDNEFLFNTIVGNNQKETRSIAIANSKVLLDRLDELAKAAVNRKE